MALRRSFLTIATAAVLAVSVAPAATATTDPDAREAASILATAEAGEPVTVVTTIDTPSGPTFETTVADSRREALGEITDALDEPGTVGVDVAHPVSIAGTLDTAAPVTSTARRPKRVNDSLRSRQWSLTRLWAEKVWRKSSGKGAVVAVIDTGVQATHPDLKGRVLKGYDFIGGDRSANDSNGHGTHVAGIVAATANNKRGIAGLAPSARILPVRVLDSAGNGNTLTVARGINYAVRKGADVINLSLAGTQSDVHIEAAVRNAIRRGVVVVAAAGNAGCSAPTSYPAALPGVIGVGATDRRNRVPGFSNCGTYVDLVAPGVSIRSTMIKRSAPGLGCSYGSSYCSLSGTSMASPHVAAAAAILVSRTRHRLGVTKMTRLLTSRADDRGQRGYDRVTGHGLLNIRRTLKGR